MRLIIFSKSGLNFIILAAIASVMQSCASYYPSLTLSSAQNIPLLKEKNDIRAEAGTGTEILGIRAAYAITDHLGVMASYSYGRNDLKGGYPEYPDLILGLRNGGDLAFGYFKNLKNNITIEVYAGAERYYRYYSTSDALHSVSTTKSNITKPFIQVDCGYDITKWFQVALSCRTGYNMFDHYEKTLEVAPNNPYAFIKPYDITQISGNTSVDPALKLRFSYGKFGVFFQTGATLPTRGYHSEAATFFYNIGVSMNWGVR